MVNYYNKIYIILFHNVTNLKRSSNDKSKATKLFTLPKGQKKNRDIKFFGF